MASGCDRNTRTVSLSDSPIIPQKRRKSVVPFLLASFRTRFSPPLPSSNYVCGCSVTNSRCFQCTHIQGVQRNAQQTTTACPHSNDRTTGQWVSHNAGKLSVGSELCGTLCMYNSVYFIPVKPEWGQTGAKDSGRKNRTGNICGQWDWSKGGGACREARDVLLAVMTELQIAWRTATLIFIKCDVTCFIVVFHVMRSRAHTVIPVRINVLTAAGVKMMPAGIWRREI